MPTAGFYKLYIIHNPMPTAISLHARVIQKPCNTSMYMCNLRYFTRFALKPETRTLTRIQQRLGIRKPS